MRGDSAQEAAALGARAREGASGPSVLHPVHQSPPVTTGHHPGHRDGPCWQVFIFTALLCSTGPACGLGLSCDDHASP